MPPQSSPPSPAFPAAAPPGVGTGWGPGGPWQPPSGYPGPLGPPGFGPAAGWPPARKSRKPLWVTLGAGGGVLLVVAIVLAITLASGGGTKAGGGSAADVVKGYLEALSRGDAEAALAFSSDQPASKEFLSDEVLRKQIGQWPITNIRILNDDSHGAGGIGFAQVHVAANFGDKTSDATMSLKKNDGKWTLPSAAIKLEPNTYAGDDAAAKTVTFFGKPQGSSTLYLFPGWIDVGSTNPYLTVTTKPLLLDQLTLGGSTYARPDVALSDAGRKAARDQLIAALANCQRSNLLAPPDCPMAVKPSGLADGTASWGPADISAVNFDLFDPFRLELSFSGEVKAPITVKTTSGATQQGDVSQFLAGTADLAKTPPALSFH